MNVSSLAAIQPFESWAVYCAAKAAREMFHRVLAEEQKKITSPVKNLLVLNYAPGPLDTNMQKEIREGLLVDAPTREYFTQLKANDQLVDANVSSERLLKVLVDAQFESGSHIDFYDLDAK